MVLCLLHRFTGFQGKRDREPSPVSFRKGINAMIRIGLCGCGGIAWTHARALHVAMEQLNRKAEENGEGKQVTLAAVTAIADVRSDRFALIKEIYPEAEEFASANDLIDSGSVDVVWLALPSYLHAEHAIRAMEKGLDVFCEKPVALTCEDMDAMLETQQRTGAKVMVGQVVRFFPAYAALKKIVLDGRYGRLNALTLTRLTSMPRWSWQNWFADLDKSGSVYMDLHIHDLDYVRWLLGEPDSVSSLHTLNADGMPNQAMTTMLYKDKTDAPVAHPPLFVVAQGLWDVSPAQTFCPGYTAYFEHATLHCDGDNIIASLEDGTSEPLPVAVEEKKDDNPQINVASVLPYALEDEYFLDRLLSGKPVEECSLEDAVKSARLARKLLDEAIG